MGTKKLLSFLLSIVMSISCVAFVSAEEKVNADGPVISSTRQLQESSTGMTYTIVYTMGDGGEGWDYEDESTSAAFTIRTL